MMVQEETLTDREGTAWHEAGHAVMAVTLADEEAFYRTITPTHPSARHTKGRETMGEHVLDQVRFWHRGREYTVGELTLHTWQQIQQEMQADREAREARIAEVVATNPLFGGYPQD